MNIRRVLEELKKERKVFHSEDDFKFALAWKIKEVYANAKVRLEYSPEKIPNMHTDIMVFYNGSSYPIELKYKTSKLNVAIDDESYILKNHYAQDGGRYDYLRDIHRLEILRDNFDNYRAGYAIIISNDQTYWSSVGDKQTVCDSFRIHDGAMRQGVLSWSEVASKGTTKGRETPIELNDAYLFSWQEYSKIDVARNGNFRICIIEVKK